jgi:hypothetical protein
VNVRKQGGRALALLILALILAACLPEPPPTPTPEPTPTATVTPTITPTIVWFPATATRTAAPTIAIEPTEDLRPALGEVLLRDPFTDPDQWGVTRTAAGSVAYGNEELTLAVAQSKGSLLSFRKTPQLNNFYLEIDAQPSLCRGADAYGLLLRAASAGDFYRLVMTCEGQVRMERVKNSKNVPLSEWTTSGQIQPGGMLPARVGVAAQGEDLNVFINGVYQFSVKDPVFTSGAVGVFARAAGDTSLTVNFSNLVVYNVKSSP